MKRLTVKYYGELSFIIEWTPLSLVCTFGNEHLSPAIERWSHGLNEYIIVDGEPEPRSTPLNHPEFLIRLSKYLQRQFSSGEYTIEDL